jgi:hypothetical protein
MHSSGLPTALPACGAREAINCTHEGSLHDAPEFVGSSVIARVNLPARVGPAPQ